MFDPGTASQWKNAVAQALRQQRPAQPIQQAVMLRVDFLLPRPRRLQRKQDPAGEVLMRAKPDIDNMLKAVMDALTDDGWWEDDALVCSVSATKAYAAKGCESGARVSIHLLSEEAELSSAHERSQP